MTKPITKRGWTLHYTIGDVVTGVVNEGDHVADFRGDGMIVKGGKPPHKPGSTGRVYVTPDGESRESEYFPSVIGAKWVHPLVDAVGNCDPNGEWPWQ